MKKYCFTNDTWSEVPVVVDDLDDLLVGSFPCAICVHINRQRLSHTDGIRELHKRAASNASSNQGFSWMHNRDQN